MRATGQTRDADDRVARVLRLDVRELDRARSRRRGDCWRVQRVANDWRAIVDGLRLRTPSGGANWDLGSSGGSAGAAAGAPTVSVHVSFEMEGVNFAMPSPIAASAEAALIEPPPPDASCGERFRDSVTRTVRRSQ